MMNQNSRGKRFLVIKSYLNIGILVLADGYPKTPPKFIFDKVNGEALVHENIYSNGDLCIPSLTVDNWKGSEPMKTILYAIKDILHKPNAQDAANKSFTEPAHRPVCFILLMC